MTSSSQKRSKTGRLFTVEDANLTLPLVRLVAEDLVETHEELVELKRVYADAREKQPHQVDELPPVDSDLYKMDETLMVKMLRLQSFVREIEEIGGTVGRLDLGEVEFPAVLDGRKIVLCWMCGEERVCHWHEVGEVDARYPLPAGVTS